MTASTELDKALAVLRRGGVIGLPTETVYGLAADAENELAVRRIFAVKGRPSSHPLIVHVADAERARSWVASWTDEAQALADAFWPGPLTMVLKKSGRASDAVTGGQDTVAVRVPRHPLALELLRAFDGGLAAPSANRFGRVSPTRAEHVRTDLGDDVELVLDGGPSEVGVESSIVDLSSGEPALLRPGGVTLQDLERVLKRPVRMGSATDVRAPGMLPSHYAPKAGVVVVAPELLAAQAQVLLAQGRRVAVVAPERIGTPEGTERLVIPDDAAGFARELYATLRAIDTLGVDVAVMALPPREGLGLAVEDRLIRAAAPR